MKVSRVSVSYKSCYQLGIFSVIGQHCLKIFSPLRMTGVRSGFSRFMFQEILSEIVKQLAILKKQKYI